MKKKPILIVSGIAVLVIGWIIAANLFGPNSEHGIAKEIERLQKDSIALQGDFKPKGHYTTIQDIWTEVKTIRDYGNPLRFGDTETDSIRMYRNERTANLARYNVQKSDSVLADVLPLWRAAASFALEDQLKAINANTVVKVNKEFPEYTGLEIYSIRYLNKDAVDEDVKDYNSILGALGFKSVIYATTPESIGIEYTFN